MPEELVRVAERSNPLRSFLLVSTVLGKHLPLPIVRCRAAGETLALRVADDPRLPDALDGLLSGELARAGAIAATVAESPPPTSGRVSVVGMAETATALAEQVAGALECDWWQTTTRLAADSERRREFAEPHSHAPAQWFVLPEPATLGEHVVIVDDELTTGTTAAELIALLHDAAGTKVFTVACLVDGRSGSGPLDELAGRLGLDIDVVSLASSIPEVGELPKGWSGGSLPMPGGAGAGGAADVNDVELSVDVPEQGSGQTGEERRALAAAAAGAAAGLGLDPETTLVLGVGEHLAVAQHFARGLGPETLSGSTTRSPVLVTDAGDYPIRNGVTFPNPEDETVAGYAYNVAQAGCEDVVVHFAGPDRRRRGQPLLEELHARTGLRVHAVTMRSR